MSKTGEPDNGSGRKIKAGELQPVAAAVKEPEAENEDMDPGGFLRQLGLVGLEELELPILCSLVTGDPLLMVGEHGTAKTALSAAVAGALDLEFHAYDASKALFEDIIGFPNPEALGQGELDYVPTSVSLWGKEFILVDEISRANAQTQNKWLEVIRSRRLMGKKLPELRYIFAAMNPPGQYQGAMPLDPAVAGRFSFVLEMPSTAEMDAADRREVLRAVSSDDAPLLRETFSKSIHGCRQVNLAARLVSIRRRLPQVVDEMGEKIDRYLSCLVDGLRPSEEELCHLDGRRLGMLRRSMLVGFAVDKPADEEQLNKLLKKILFNSLPHLALGQEIPRHTYEMAHYDAFAALTDNRSIQTNQTLDGGELVNRALEKDNLVEALPVLASLGRALQNFKHPDSSVDLEAELISRILTTGRNLAEELSPIKREPGVLEAVCRRGEPARALAVVLLGWWLVEKEEERAYQLSRNNVEEVSEFIERLSKRITKVKGGEAK